MAQTADGVFAAGLELSPAERAAVAQRLLESLNPEGPADPGQTETGQTETGQANIHAAWSEEIRSRVDDVLGERLEMNGFEETRARASGILDELRA